MKDFKAISKTYYGKIKSNLGIKKEYAKFFKEQNTDYYLKIFNDKPLIIQDFIKFVKNKTSIENTLEIGCSTGIFPIKYNDLFSEIEYTGIDLSQKSIEYCKAHSNFEFICDDFLKMNFNKKFDLIFSFDVIDHVYDIDLFISKIVDMTKKYAYVNSYRGYFPDLENHKSEWRDSDGINYSNISVKQIQKALLNKGLSLNEFSVTGLAKDKNKNHLQTVIKIDKTARNN